MQCLSMITVRVLDGYQKVPCGKCAFCLTNKRSQWMFRLYHEMRLQKHPGYFLTLTYDEKHVKRVADGRLSLRFYDVQLFFKRLRKQKFYVKYICVGEYGGVTKRPHYHMLLWTDASADVIQSEWKSSKDNSPMGSIHFGMVTMQSAMYCLKYIIQPKVKDDEGIERTRAQFSKGIGLGYLTSEVYDYHTFDYEKPVLFSVIDGRKVALPRYYKQKIFTKAQMRKEAHKVKWQLIKESRKEMRKLIAQGIKNTKIYRQALRVEQARRIIETTKYNLSL